MAVRVAINGFGRIGRLVARAMMQRPGEYELVAINDLTDAKTLAHLFKYDSVHRIYPGTVRLADDKTIEIDGRKVSVIAEKVPANLPWGAMKVDVAIESTGVFTKRTSEKGGYGDHIKAGARKVVLSAPASDEPDLTVVLGVNDKQLNSSHVMVSNASCTTNCLAPVVKVLNDSFGLEHGLMVTIHAYTNDQVTADQVHKDLRRARAAAINIIPSSTGAAKTVGKVIPEMNGKLNGYSFRVPVADGSVTDFTALLKKSATVQEINAALKSAAEGPLKGVLQYSEEPLVSSDIVGNPHSSIIDALNTMTMPGNGGTLVKVVAWYDNEWGYSCRTVDLVKRIAAL